MKLSGADLNTAEDPPAHSDASRTACALVALAPERLVRASDWPRFTDPHEPDDPGSP